MAADIISAARLRELLDYNPKTGVFTNRIKRSRKTIPGAVAGCFKIREVRIRLDGRLYLAHRLAWLFMTGAWPEFEVDHEDGDPQNNRWANLWDVTHQTNLQNQRKARADNKLGLLGVSRKRSRFVAQIAGPDGSRHSQTFSTPEDAHAAYVEAKRLLHAGNTL